MIFPPLVDKTRWEGLIVSGWLLLIDALLVFWILKRPTDTLRFLLVLFIILTVPLIVHFLYRTWGAFTLEYWLDRNAVTIRWANMRQVIPLSEIRQVIQRDQRFYRENDGANDSNLPENFTSENFREKQSWRYWPAPYVRTNTHTVPPQMLFATQPPVHSLLLETKEMTFVISPADEAGFLAALQERYRLGPSQAKTVQQVRSSIFARFVGPGRVGPVLLGIGLLGVLTLFGILMVQFPDLPNPLPIRYTREGLPEVVRDKDVLFRIPTIGLFAWIMNGLWGVLMAWRRQPVGAYLLWSGTIVVQAFLFMALRSVLP